MRSVPQKHFPTKWMENDLADFLILLLFPALLITAAATDIFTMKISNWISLVLIVSFGLAAWLAGLPGATIISHVAACTLVLAIGFTLFAFNLIGGGDAKFLAAVALWFGFSSLLPLIFVTAIFGGVLCATLVFIRIWPLPDWLLRNEWIKRLHNKSVGAPYGVAISAAALVLYAETPIMKSFGT